ncbi:MAG: roadblock/LC7 domain-containing protein [Desulfobacteraceae bacterium]|nr:roadblock/LC7 domain-containing protein [Desulfobacteraceae bacterium]
MQDILRHINSVEGVIGSAVFNENGAVVDHAFPPLIDAESLHSAAGLVLECTQGLQISRSLDIIDLRYAEGRIIIKAFPGALLCLLCTKNINLPVLNITLKLAVKKLGALLPNIAEIAGETADSSILRLRISHLANRDASKSFDSLGMIAVSQPTSSYISEFYKSAFKKLTLINATAGTSGTFPVMIMKDIDQQFDGTIIVGPGIEKKLQLNEGDNVEIKIG